jgi:hypothetical protein
MSRFDDAIKRIDEANAQDPHSELDGAGARPKELLYAERLSAWVEKLEPNASEALRLAARCQHLCRWKVPRSTYPMDRAGYLKWREDLKKFHAEKSGEILRDAGYDDVTIEKVRALNLKKNFPNDPESRVIEDALCLMFFEHQFAGIVREHPEQKVIGILQKTWKKMTPKAKEIALSLPLGSKEKELVGKVVGQR